MALSSLRTIFCRVEETRVHLEKIGIPAEKLTVSGIPIDPLFAETKDKTAMREKYGLEKDKLTIMVSAGGFGVGNIEHLLTGFERFANAFANRRNLRSQ